MNNLSKKMISLAIALILMMSMLGNTGKLDRVNAEGTCVVNLKNRLTCALRADTTKGVIRELDPQDKKLYLITITVGNRFQGPIYTTNLTEGLTDPNNGTLNANPAGTFYMLTYQNQDFQLTNIPDGYTIKCTLPSYVYLDWSTQQAVTSVYKVPTFNNFNGKTKTLSASAATDITLYMDYMTGSLRLNQNRDDSGDAFPSYLPLEYNVKFTGPGTDETFKNRTVSTADGSSSATFTYDTKAKEYVATLNVTLNGDYSSDYNTGTVLFNYLPVGTSYTITPVDTQNCVTTSTDAITGSITAAKDSNNIKTYSEHGSSEIASVVRKFSSQGFIPIDPPTPTATPTATPTVKPTATPTATPTVKPTATPTATPTVKPTTTPKVTPTTTPKVTPTTTPRVTPTGTPTGKPDSQVTPTVTPTVTPIVTSMVTPEVTGGPENDPSQGGPAAPGGQGTTPASTQPAAPASTTPAAPASSAPAAPAASAASTDDHPAVGSVWVSPSAKYIVTGTDTLTYKEPVKTTVTKVAISKTVTISGYTYKVTKIAPGAFKNCKKLKKVTISENIESIGKEAFFGCSKLNNVIIKTNLLGKKSIGTKAFAKIYQHAVFKVPAKKQKVYKSYLKKAGAPKKAKVKK